MRKYAETVTDLINNTHDDVNAEVVEIMKMNDESLIGVRINKANAGSAPIVYVDTFINSGMTAEQCAEEIEILINTDWDTEVSDKWNMEWDEVRSDIAMRLVNLEYNKRFLEDKIYTDLGNGLAVLFDVARGDLRAVVTKALADTLGCDTLKLTLASQTSEVGAPVLYELGERLMTDAPTNWLEGDTVIESNMYVLTTKSGIYGASAIYRVGVGEKIKELIGDYYLLPSSVHEWIVIPESANISIKEQCNMVRGANETVVDKCDILSYHVYKWTSNGLSVVA